MIYVKIVIFWNPLTFFVLVFNNITAGIFSTASDTWQPYWFASTLIACQKSFAKLNAKLIFLQLEIAFSLKVDA